MFQLPVPAPDVLRRYARQTVDHPFATAMLMSLITDNLNVVPTSEDDIKRQTCIQVAIERWRDGEMVAMDMALQEAAAIGATSASASSKRLVRATMGYDPKTRIVWGVGDTLAECMANTGWTLVVAGKVPLMAHLRWQRASSGFAAAHHIYGADIPWRMNDAGLAEPEAGYEAPVTPIQAPRVVAVPIHGAGHA